MIVTPSAQVAGHCITRNVGLVYGNTIRARARREGHSGRAVAHRWRGDPGVHEVDGRVPRAGDRPHGRAG